MHTTRMDAIEQPPIIRLSLRSYDLHTLLQSRIWLIIRSTEVIESPKYVVAPVVGEREVEIRRIGDLAGALSPKQRTLQQVLIGMRSGRVHVV